MRTITILPFFILLVCLPLVTKAQTADNKVLTGVSVTFMDYKGIVNKQFFNPRNFNPGVRINANMYMNAWMNYTLGASFIPRASYPQVDGTFNPQLLIDVNTGFQLKANNGKIMDENAVVAPYIYTGLGYSTSEGKSGMYLPGALGVRFRLGNHVSLNIESMYRVKFNSTIQPMSHTIGFNFVLPSQKPPIETASRGNKTTPKPVITTKPKKEVEAPKEEVVENKPKKTTPTIPPVNTVKKEEVAENEPIEEKRTDDQDGDGVLDRFDACPDVAGPIEEGGCPEREKIAAAETVPNEDVTFFPDADNDGVEDRFDPCPHVFGKKEEGGCPERYKIGKASEENSARNPMPSELVDTKTPVKPREIPSAIMPREISEAGAEAETPAVTNENPVAETPVAESPELSEQDSEMPTLPQNDQVEENQQAVSIYDMSRLKIIAMNMIYKPGTDALIPETETYIQELKDLLAKYPKYKLVIRGYYNAGREEDDNKVMSVKRAFQVKRQLILTKGMPPVRMNPNGFGSQETTTKNESRIELELIPMK